MIDNKERSLQDKYMNFRPGSLNAELEQIEDEGEKLRFMEQQRSVFKEKFEADGGDYSEASQLHYWYRQYCGEKAGYYPNVSRKWRAEIEKKPSSLV